MTFYIPVLVSILTAAAAAYATIRNTRVTTQTQREMSNLADRTARDFKEKDYKNDFYKKIIDKRLIAWEHAERFVELISISRAENGTGEWYYSYFSSVEDFVKVQNASMVLNTRSFWMDERYRAALQSFIERIGRISDEFESPMQDETNEEQNDSNQRLRIIGKRLYSEFKMLTIEIMQSQSATLSKLHDIESFLADRV